METTTATPPPRELNEDDLAFLERYSAFRRSQHAGGGHHEEREEPSQEHERARLRQHIRYLWTTCLAEASTMYGCIRELYFLRTRIEQHPYYPHVEATIKSDPDARFLDLGSCFATDTRKVIVDGWKETNVVTSDVIPDYWNYSLALYEDAADIKCKVAIGDVTSDPHFVESLVAEGLFAHVWIGRVLHALTEEKVEALLRAVHAILKPGGSLFGDCVGTNAEPGQWDPTQLRNRKTGHHHSSESLKQTLDRIGFVEVEVRQEKLELPGLVAPPDRVFLIFSAKRPAQ